MYSPKVIISSVCIDNEFLLRFAFILATKTLGEKGFVINSSAPMSKPLIISSSASLAERIVIFWLGIFEDFFILSKNSKPLMPGKFKSKIIKSGFVPFSNSLSASSAL